MFKECGRRATYDGRRRTDNGACLYYKLNYEPKGSGGLKSLFCILQAVFDVLYKYIIKKLKCFYLMLMTSLSAALSRICPQYLKG